MARLLTILIVGVGTVIVIFAYSTKLNDLLPNLGNSTNSTVPLTTQVPPNVTPSPALTSTPLHPTPSPIPLYHFDWKQDGIYYKGSMISDEDFRELLLKAKQQQLKVECTIFEGVPASKSQKWRTIINEDVGIHTEGCVPNF